jgi:hypothetical protein
MGIQAVHSSTAVDLTTQVQTQKARANAAVNQGSQIAPKKTGGSPPPGGGDAKPASPSSSSSGSSSAKIYAKQDTNQDGIVSQQELLQYSLKHPAEETENQSSVSTSQLQTGLKAYQQDQQANSQ